MRAEVGKDKKSGRETLLPKLKIGSSFLHSQVILLLVISQSHHCAAELDYHR